MDLQLNDKRALVSGSTAGIGFAIAQGLAREGASVVINGRTQNRVEQATDKLRQALPRARVEGAAADLGDAAGVNELIEAAGGIDILVNCLGIFEPKAFAKITDEDWLTFFQTNVMSGIRLSRHYLPRMEKQGWGRIVFISSESALHIPTEMIHYGMTKTAQLAVARGLAEATGNSGVTVNTVLPGPTHSEGVGGFVENMAGERGVSFETMEKEFFQNARPTSLIQRFATTEEVANMVSYVCSPLSSATTGAALRVDGGVVRAIP